MSDKDDARELKAAEVARVAAPVLDYRPPVPKGPVPPIGLIGCGGIARNHLEAYRDRGYGVAVLCDINLEAARTLRDEFFPGADITDETSEVLGRKDIGVVDLATHPDHRLALIEQALEAGKHVLSQKPFVTDLTEGRRLVELAERKGLKLAVNQNGRWAPYVSYLRQAVAEGLLGDIASCDIQIAWDHSWIEGTRFEEIHHIILYDFAIHWFDITRCVFGGEQAVEVFSQLQASPGQTIAPPLNAQSVIRFQSGVASLVFRGHTAHAPGESIVVTGTKGTFRSSGAVCGNDEITLITAEGEARVELEGKWFNDGFAGAMGELLCAIEEGREPVNAARTNLPSLQLCFAAVASADSGQPVCPEQVKALPVVHP
ncbi:Gfo/Idh/MocA family protein [Haloferula sp. A504]|uniref:Gfo/Idh/MocA family protein n=1 Tax=Haloferula sp. A504 TaxID=3373601 RepID=UPI0031C860A2|nr:Gfo/Idh/MocA family oxidoreductase [Verrucomicrobiaceae bacterium E54]